MENVRLSIGGFSPITISAALSIAALLGVAGYKLEQQFSPTNNSSSVVATSATSTGQNDTIDNVSQDLYGFGSSPSDSSATSSTADIDHIGSNVVGQLAAHYMVMQQAGTYTPDAAAQVATDMAPNVTATVTYKQYTAADIKTDANISYTRMLKYRADLKVSVAPLLKSNTPELTIFGMYTESKDPKYLTQLQSVAKNYRAAATATAAVVVPADAVSYQIAILNAMQEYASTLDELATHADDPITTAALLRSYNQAEQDMLNSFNALPSYYNSKQA